MILENGLVRTMDRQIPTQRALAIAGDRIAGGVGVHETALASPEAVDLGGRVVLPGFTDSHVHFPSWALAQRQVSLEGCASLDEALARIAAADRGTDTVIRGYGWRSGDWAGEEEPTRDRLDAVTGEVPAAMIAKDHHSLWLNSAALALANGELEVDGGVVERDEHGEPTGVLREEAAWQFKERHLTVPDDAYVEAMRAGLKLAAARGVTAVHDKDGWLGALRLWQRLEQTGSLSLRVWQSVPAAMLDERRGIGPALGLRQPDAAARLPEGLHGRHARLEDRPDARRVGVTITSREELAEIVLAGAAAGFPVAVHAIGDRANREALDAFEQTRETWHPLGLRHRIEHAQLLAPRISPASPSSASRRRCSSPTRPRIATWPTGSGPARPAAPTHTAR